MSIQTHSPPKGVVFEPERVVWQYYGSKNLHNFFTGTPFVLDYRFPPQIRREFVSIESFSIGPPIFCILKTKSTRLLYWDQLKNTFQILRQKSPEHNWRLRNRTQLTTWHFCACAVDVLWPRGRSAHALCNFDDHVVAPAAFGWIRVWSERSILRLSLLCKCARHLVTKVWIKNTIRVAPTFYPPPIPISSEVRSAVVFVLEVAIVLQL